MASALLASRAEPLWGERKVYARKAPNPNPKTNHNPNPNSYATKQLNHGRQIDEIESISPAVSDDFSSFNRISSNHPEESTNGAAGFVTYSIAAYTKRELKDLKRRLVLELEEVQKLRSRIETEFQFGSSSQFSDVREIPQMQKPQNKKQPFGNKRLVPFDSSRDLKRPALDGRVVSGMMKQCGQILKNVMKHKHSWVFNDPVDVVGMGLHDYYQIIKHPMDLGTVKTKLEQNLYATPMDFAADVRLTFNNALTYNPQGHDVFTMAKLMQTLFEKQFGAVDKKFQSEQHRIASLAAQEIKWAAERKRQHMMPADEMRWEREAVSCDEKRPIHSSSTRTSTPEAGRRYNSIPTHVPASPPPQPSPPPLAQQPAFAMQDMRQQIERPAIRKQPKPKARDINKREMSFDEKQKLSTSLQDLPQEKMDQVVQIMRKSNVALSQNDDEIEVDIEVLDKETLWELDRFVCNYKKMMCKAKRQQELEVNRIPESAEGNKSPVSEMTEGVASSEKIKKAEPVCVEEDIDIGEDMPTNNFPPVEIEKDSGYVSSSESDSSSGSSSSSDSDSGSSSDSDSDADNATAQSPHIQSKPSPQQVNEGM